MVKSISITELKSNFSSVIDKIHQKSNRFIVKSRGKSRAVMMSMDDYEGLLETIEILSDMKLMNRIEQAEKEMAEGKGKSWEEI